MVDLLAMGEALIDFTPAGFSPEGRNLYERNAGGAAVNLAVAAARMGAKVAFLGKVGEDSQGHYVIDEVASCGVDVSSVCFDPKVYTTLAFVTLSQDGERDFSFCRKPGADTCLQLEDLDMDLIDSARCLHFGALALNAEPTKSTTAWVVKRVHERGGLVAFDANYRAFLWETEQAYKTAVTEAIRQTDLLKISEEEAALVTGEEELEQQLQYLLNLGPRLIALTLGAKGVLLAWREFRQQLPGFVVEQVDTTGAGDSFFGAFLATLLEEDLDLEDLNEERLLSAARVGNATAALCVTKRGGIPAIPNRTELEAFLKERS